jgi:hypothetical protein
MLNLLTRPSFQVWMPDGSIMQFDPQLNSPHAAAEFLESGGIIYFPQSPFSRDEADSKFLLTQHQEDASYHKNIAYKPHADIITGLQKANPVDVERLRCIMADFSKQAIHLVESLFPSYVDGYKLDFASYRPIEEEGRRMRIRARNDLIHVDSFPTRPVYGDRILRVFENINPQGKRVWRTSDTFEKLAAAFKDKRPAPKNMDKLSAIGWMCKTFGIKSNAGSAYDEWMLDFHNFLKENAEFQAHCRKSVWEFPARSAWIVYTDMVSHSVLSGKYALEQTFIIEQKNMVLPEKAPINILRRLYA